MDDVRRMAMEMALEICRGHTVDADMVLAEARKFEAYLRGGDEQPADDPTRTASEVTKEAA